MALPITDALILRVAAALRSGGWRYTRRQLYYAVCAEAEIPPNNAAANGQAGLGVLCLLLGVILLGVRPAGYVFLGAGVLLFAGGAMTRFGRPPARGRLLAMSYDEFQTRSGSLSLDGLIDDAAATGNQGAADADVAVVVDSNETAAMVAANAGLAGLDDVAVSVTQPAARARSIVCLHDASPRGCALVAALQDEGHQVIDAGLRPSQLRADADEQVLEGAPARLPRDLSGVLDATEIEWLTSGRRVELATRTPPQVMTMLSDAIGTAGQPVDHAG